MSEPMPGAAPAQQDAEADTAQAVGAAAAAEQASSEGPEVPTGRAEQAGAVPGEGPHPHDASDAAEYAEAQEPAQPVDARDEDADEEEDEDEGPRPLGLHVEPTGHAPVDVQLRRLEDADHLAVSGHLEVYEDVHRGLREALAGLDRHPASAPATGPASAPGPGRPVPPPQPHRS